MRAAWSACSWERSDRRSHRECLVILDAKARRRHFLDTIEAFFEFEYLTANAAQKVMMMALVRTFVTRRLAGNFHRDDVPVFVSDLRNR